AGPGKASLTLSGNTNSRVFKIGSQATATICGLTISGGHAPDGGYVTIYYPNYAPPPAGGNGGAIYNAGSLSLSNCTVLNCSAGAGGLAHYQANGGTFAGPG